ncbi:hypothetical protein [Tunicatimonas pelagia]|uniref:hypothetical protein n=1 Tax=Tunicatimonas pelagia TaxID=931531 RepID=UPI0026656F52|nr:hypothetical protein [Tunicatimonas pelagia]WKN46502.1 hypothetical protein P0M28_30595 [Tunicatimonas pelagia]
MNSPEWLNSKFINKAAVARAVLGENPQSKNDFYNKMANRGGKKFSKEQLNKIDEVRKKIIEELL